MVSIRCYIRMGTSSSYLLSVRTHVSFLLDIRCKEKRKGRAIRKGEVSLCSTPPFPSPVKRFLLEMFQLSVAHSSSGVEYPHFWLECPVLTYRHKCIGHPNPKCILQVLS